MSELDSLIQLEADFREQADFIFIYIGEAHATDGWKFQKNEFSIATHRSLADRLVAAQEMMLRLPSYRHFVDDMADEACLRYRAHPERLCIIQHGKVSYAGEQGPFGFHPQHVRAWLEKLG